MEVSVPELWAHCPSKQLLAQNQRSLRPLQVYPFQQASEGQSRLTFTPAGWSQQGLPRLSTTLIEDIMICYLGGVKMQMKDVALELLCQRKIEMPEVTPPVQDGLWDLPGFSEARDYLDRKGLSSTWVDEVVDPSGRLACFEKNGKPHYRSECPAYEGYRLDGSTGSVQCRNVPFLLPGLQWDNTCSKNPEQCPFLLKKDD